MLSRCVILSAAILASVPAGASAERIAYHDGTEISGTVLRIEVGDTQVLQNGFDGRFEDDPEHAMAVFEPETSGGGDPREFSPNALLYYVR